MFGQPNMPGWIFGIDKVEPVEAMGLEPDFIVNEGESFDFKVTLTLDGAAAGAGVAPWYDPAGPTEGAKIEHFALNLQTGAVTTLPYKIPTGKPSLVKDVAYPVTTGSYTTGPAMDLEQGTYQITTCIRLTNAPLDEVEASFFVSYLMVIVPV